MASSSTRLPPIGLDVSTPLGLAKAYATGAGECLADARRLQEGFSDRTGHFIITLHAIELGLKAFLLAEGYTEQTLRSRPFGHDLVELYKAAQTKGLVLSTPNAEELIKWTNEWHSHGVKIRYEFTEERTLPMCETLFPLASEIIQKTALRRSLIVDRVSPLNYDGSIFEVHSVGIGVDPIGYARALAERDRTASKPARDYLIDRSEWKFKLLADGSLSALGSPDAPKGRNSS